VQYAKHIFYDTNSHILFLFHQMAFVYDNKHNRLSIIINVVLMIKAVGYCDNHLFCDKIKTYNDCTNRKHPTDQSIHNLSKLHRHITFPSRKTW